MYIAANPEVMEYMNEPEVGLSSITACDLMWLMAHADTLLYQIQTIIHLHQHSLSIRNLIRYSITVTDETITSPVGCVKVISNMINHTNRNHRLLQLYCNIFV